MAYPAYIRDKARRLRRDKQLTIDEIAERLALPRTTIYYWVRDLPIERNHRASAWPDSARRKGNESMQRKYRQLRDAAYATGRAEFLTLASDPTFRDFVCMYIGEGYKRRRNTVSIGNSDPAVVKLAHRWICQLSARKVVYSFQYHADQDPEALKSFWCRELSVKPAQFTFQRKSNSGRLGNRTWRSRYGVLTSARTTHTFVPACKLGSIASPSNG